MFETGSTTERPELTWQQFHAELSETLLDLTKGEILTVEVLREPPVEPAEPDTTQNRVTRLIRSLTRSEPCDEAPLLQFFRMDLCLYCECAGPVESGGWVRYSAEQQQQIAALGWAQPVGKDRKRWGYPQYCAYFPHEGETISLPPVQRLTGDWRDLVDAPAAAGLAIDTLRGPMGVTSTGGLTVVRRG